MDLLSFDSMLLTVSNRSGKVTLTPREYQILGLLYQGDQHAARRADLYAQVWNGVRVCNKVLDVHVSKLRKKLSGIGVQVTFEKPASYKLIFPVGGETTEETPSLTA
jgi:DNA-binding response OmpR family regulator